MRERRQAAYARERVLGPQMTNQDQRQDELNSAQAYQENELVDVDEFKGVDLESDEEDEIEDLSAHFELLNE